MQKRGQRWSHLLFIMLLAAFGLRAFVAPQARIAGLLAKLAWTVWLHLLEGSSETRVIMHAISRRHSSGQHLLEDDPLSKLKVYVYDMPSKYNRQVAQRDPRCLTHMFSAEIHIHLFLLASSVRTFDPDEANWFYTPVYTNCDLTKTGLPFVKKMPRMVASAVQYISTRWPYWNRTGGSDHFFVAPHDFGACFHFQEKKAIERGILPLLHRTTLVQTFGHKNHSCLKSGSIIIPPYVSPRKIFDHAVPVGTPRSIFAYFRGAFYDIDNDPKGGYYARGVRAMIWENFRDNPLFDISDEHPPTYYEDMQRSIFCLCPLGWAPWSPRIVEAVQFGCIPVIIADEIVLPFDEVMPWEDMSVLVSEESVAQLDTILTSIPRDVVARKQRLLADPKLRQALLFPRFGQPGDGYHQILHALASKLPHSSSIYVDDPQATQAL